LVERERERGLVERERERGLVERERERGVGVLWRGVSAARERGARAERERGDGVAAGALSIKACPCPNLC
jgi:hypothetical protein